MFSTDELPTAGDWEEPGGEREAEREAEDVEARPILQISGFDFIWMEIKTRPILQISGSSGAREGDHQVDKFKSNFPHLDEDRKG